jgi:hypothetical protein
MVLPRAVTLTCTGPNCVLATEPVTVLVDGAELEAFEPPPPDPPPFPDDEWVVPPD